MEKKHRANMAFAHTKKLGIWAAALVFSYVDFGTSIIVGREYLAMGTTAGDRAAHVMFGMLGVSLGMQGLFTYLTGTTTNLMAVIACAVIKLSLLFFSAS